MYALHVVVELVVVNARLVRHAVVLVVAVAAEVYFPSYVVVAFAVAALVHVRFFLAAADVPFAVVVVLVEEYLCFALHVAEIALDSHAQHVATHYGYLRHHGFPFPYSVD